MSWDALQSALVHSICHFQNFKYTLLGESTDEEDGEIREGSKTRTNGLLKDTNCLIGFILYKVPLINTDYQPLAISHHKGEDIDILALNSSCCINHSDTDITIFNSAYRTNYRVVLKVFLYLTSFANTCSIDKVKAEAKLIILRIDGVSRGTGYIGYNVSLLPDKGIDKRRLTGIGATYHGKAREFLLGFALVLLGERVDDSVQKISGTGAIDRTNGIGVP